MKSMFTKSIYAGLGLLVTGKETVEQLGRKLAKQANMSEKDGERIAKHLQVQSKKALDYVQKTMETEVNKVVEAFHSAARQLSPTTPKAKASHRKGPKSVARKAKPRHHKAKHTASH
jgi:hypothetical protein